VECLERSIDACLTFFNFPPEEWISLRTTNIIERLNKEFRRRTKVMEIVVTLQIKLPQCAYIQLIGVQFLQNEFFHRWPPNKSAYVIDCQGFPKETCEAGLPLIIMTGGFKLNRANDRLHYFG